jgi:hypothetical protein
MTLKVTQANRKKLMYFKLQKLIKILYETIDLVVNNLAFCVEKKSTSMKNNHCQHKMELSKRPEVLLFKDNNYYVWESA